MVLHHLSKAWDAVVLNPCSEDGMREKTGHQANGAANTVADAGAGAGPGADPVPQMQPPTSLLFTNLQRGDRRLQTRVWQVTSASSMAVAPPQVVDKCAQSAM